MLLPLSMTKVETTEPVEMPCETVSSSGMARKEERVGALRRVRHQSSPFLSILSEERILILRVFRRLRKKKEREPVPGALTEKKGKKE